MQYACKGQVLLISLFSIILKLLACSTKKFYFKLGGQLTYIWFSYFGLQVVRYLGNSKEDEISWALIQGAISSVAQTAIIPMQDILGLGSSARMNIPATQV